MVKYDCVIFGICLALIISLYQLRAHIGRAGLKKQNRQCTCNVMLRRVRGTILPWESNKYCLLVCMYVHVTLLFLHATRVRHVVTSRVAFESSP